MQKLLLIFVEGIVFMGDAIFYLAVGCLIVVLLIGITLGIMACLRRKNSVRCRKCNLSPEHDMIGKINGRRQVRTATG